MLRVLCVQRGNPVIFLLLLLKVPRDFFNAGTIFPTLMSLGAAVVFCRDSACPLALRGFGALSARGIVCGRCV